MGLEAVSNEQMLDMYGHIKYNIFKAPKLAIPGFLIQVFNEDRNFEFHNFQGYQIDKFKVNLMSEAYYDSLIFSKSMISDHTPVASEEALLTLVNINFGMYGYSYK